METLQGNEVVGWTLAQVQQWLNYNHYPMVAVATDDPFVQQLPDGDVAFRLQAAIDYSNRPA